MGSDMEITGMAKYKGNKDYHAYFNNGGVIASVYSGLEDDMRCVWEELENRMGLSKSQGGALQIRDLRQLLAESLGAVITSKKSLFQMLVGIVKVGEQPLFLRVHGKRISPAKEWELIGAGDCELTRYLTSLMHYTNLTNQQAALWASHIVSTANLFVQSVGQGIRLSILDPRGTVHYMDGTMFSKSTDIIDKFIGHMWSIVCNLNISEDQCAKLLQEFSAQVLAARKKVPTIMKN